MLQYKSKFQMDFELLQRLGKGGYGMVFKVKHKTNGQEYAIKRIDLTEHPSDVMEREIRIKDCSHPYVVKYIDSWIERPPPKWQENEDEKWMKKFNLMPIVLGWTQNNDDGSEQQFQDEMYLDLIASKPPKYLYIQMELCKKHNLADWLLRSNIKARKEKYLDIFEQIVKAVKHIHSQELIHRDLKPENILFGLDGRIRIGDFGTVTRDHTHRNARGKRNHVMQEHTEGIGTKWYKAPELEGKHYDCRVDIFSLGVILFELINPFRTESERFDAIDHLRETPFPKDFDARFENEFYLMKRMLSRNPKKRPTIGCIEEHLSRWKTGRWETERPDASLTPSDFFDALSTLLGSFLPINKHPPLLRERSLSYSDKKEKIVSKSRPMKMKKDNRILQ